MPITQAYREVSASCMLGEDALLLRSLVGSEQLGRLFEYRLQLFSENHEIKVADVLGSTMAVKVNTAVGDGRFFHGVVTRFGCTGEEGDLASYEAILRPGLWLLSRSANCRVFQDKSVLDVVKQVCASACYGGHVELDISRLSGEYPLLSYCVQYRETDFDFVARLLEDAGIYFYFNHEATRHVVVLADSYGAHLPIVGYEECPFVSEGAAKTAFDEYVSSWSAAGQIMSGSQRLKDFDYEKTTASLSDGLLSNASIPGAFHTSEFELYDYPGKYSTAADGRQRARAGMERQNGQTEQISARGNARGLCAGGLFTLIQHPRAEHNRGYLITGTQHWIEAGDYLSGASVGASFDCTFSAIGDKQAYRPPQVYAKPLVHGPQTAMVVGKAGEEVWTDALGRVKVQFHWDRIGTNDENSSCWVRVSQGWAGNGWGSQFLPRIGMEVVVSFLEGDPDRPLITGCVYNSSFGFPYALPANQSQSGIKTRSTLNSTGFNELRFEDKVGAEEVYMHAEKDFTREIKNDDTHTIGQDQATTVKRDQTTTVSRDQTMTVSRDQLMTISENQTMKVSGNHKMSVAKDRQVTVDGNQKTGIVGNQEVVVNGDQKVTVDKTIVITATTSIELQVGGSSIKIEPDKVTIKSVMIDIESSANMIIKGAMVDIN